VHSHKHT